MRRPPPALALAAPVVEVDDVFITRLADLAAASVPSRVPVHPAALKVAAAATGVAVIAAGGAYAADQLTAPRRPTTSRRPVNRRPGAARPLPRGTATGRRSPRAVRTGTPGTSAAPANSRHRAPRRPGRAGSPTGITKELATARARSTRASTRTRAPSTDGTRETSTVTAGSGTAPLRETVSRTGRARSAARGSASATTSCQTRRLWETEGRACPTSVT